MRRLSRLLALVALVALVIASGAWVARAHAEMATPAGASYATLILIEHADSVTEIDLGEPGPSTGDMLVWGPNALYDEAEVFGSKRADRNTAATSG
jgi:heme A synthase